MVKMRLIGAGPLEEFFENKAKSWTGTWSGPAYSNALERVKDAPTVAGKQEKEAPCVCVWTASCRREIQKPLAGGLPGRHGLLHSWKLGNQ